MAKTAGRRHQGEESISGYFRKIFARRPQLLDSKSNAELLARWKADHKATEVPNSVRNGLANLKSLLRKRLREGQGIGGKTAPQGGAVRPRSPAHNGLEALEEHIDEGLTLARNLDRDGLAGVIILLRRARNEVVWKMGE
jgi:hypothetical protein